MIYFENKSEIESYINYKKLMQSILLIESNIPVKKQIVKIDTTEKK